MGDIDPALFREQALRLATWIADYLAAPEVYPVVPATRPGEVRRSLPAAPPRTPEPLDRIVADALGLVPHVTQWNHPGFFAYFATSSTGPAVLGEFLAAALNVNGMLWKTGPAATELELLTLDWLRQMMGLGHGWTGVIHDTASTSTLVALAAAREAVPGLEARRKGLAGSAPLRLYASLHAHSSVDKAAIVLGIGQEGVRRIPADEAFRMDPAALRTAIAEDRGAGLRPFAVVATVGTTSTTSIDPVRAIADVCRAEGLWLHVDAAYGGTAAVVPELRFVLDGCEAAQSLVVNPHKWLFVPLDLSVLYTRRPDLLKAAFSLVPEYLRTTEDAAAPNLMDYGVSLGRRFRSLKLWMVIRAFGHEGLAARIREHVRLAQLFREWVQGDTRFEIAAPSPLSVVCFRLRPAGHPPAEEDARNMQVLELVNASGDVYLSHTSLHGRTVLRLAVGNVHTRLSHVARAFELLQAAAACA